jgi:multidrug resistance protein MdtO
MSEAKRPTSSLRRLENILRAELAYYPGRIALAGRIVLACTSVMMLVMVFRIPAAALGAYYPLLVSRESPQATHKSAMRIGLACTLGTAEIILGGMLTAGSPFLHFFWVIANLFVVFYLISSLKFTDAALALSVVIALAIGVWDDPASGEMRVEHSLYTLLSILMACVISAAIEALFAKKHRPDAVLVGVQQRLALVEELLQKTGAEEHESKALGIQLHRYAIRGVGDLRALLAHTNYDEGYKEQLSAVLALTGQLIELSLNLSESTTVLSAKDVSRCVAIARSVAEIRASLSREEAPDWLDTANIDHADCAILIEIERTIDLIAQSFIDDHLPVHYHLPVPAPVANKGFFVADAFQSKEHFKFGVRGTLSAMLCYLFYMSTGWMALGGSITTCFLTALPNTGASRHKQILRFAGFFLGACVLGLGAEVLILPKIDTLLQFALLFASVVAIGAWVATSGPRIAYCGFQIVLAYDLVNLNKFTINTSLVPARDAILGIILAVVAMWLVFDHLWARSSTVSVRSLLLSTLKDVARLDRFAGESAQVLNHRLIAESTRINRNFDKVRSLSDFYVFESYPKTREEAVLDRFVRTSLPQVRAFLLVKTGLLQHRFFNESRQENDLVPEIQERSSEIMFCLTKSIEQLSLQPQSMPVARDEELARLVRGEIARGQQSINRSLITEMRLCSSLLDLAVHVREGVRLNLYEDLIGA